MTCPVSTLKLCTMPRTVLWCVNMVEQEQQCRTEHVFQCSLDRNICKTCKCARETRSNSFVPHNAVCYPRMICKRASFLPRENCPLPHMDTLACPRKSPPTTTHADTHSHLQHIIEHRCGARAQVYCIYMHAKVTAMTIQQPKDTQPHLAQHYNKRQHCNQPQNTTSIAPTHSTQKFLLYSREVLR